jgi:uridine kinase
VTVTQVPRRPKHTDLTQEGPEQTGDGLLDSAVRALALWRGERGGVTVVAIDGHGASGKSTIAERLRAETGASVVCTDDFFVLGGQRVLEARRAEPTILKAPAPSVRGQAVGAFYDVTRLRAECLDELRAGRAAVYHRFDWDAGTVSAKTTRIEPNDLVLLEGVYSGSPELADLVDRAIYVDTPEPERLRRLRSRIAPQDWDEQWLQAEKEYFARTRQLASFDLVIPGSGALAP